MQDADADADGRRAQELVVHQLQGATRELLVELEYATRFPALCESFGGAAIVNKAHRLCRQIMRQLAYAE